MSALFTLGCFAYDPQSVLTAVREFALVRVKLLLDLGLRLRLSAFPGLMDGELRIAELAHSEHWDVLAALDDPKSPLCHAPSLRRALRRSTPEDFKRHHYPGRVFALQTPELMVEVEGSRTGRGLRSQAAFDPGVMSDNRYYVKYGTKPVE